MHIATAVTAQIIGENKRFRGQAKAVSKILAKQSVIVRRMDAFSIILGAGADYDFSVIGQLHAFFTSSRTSFSWLDGPVSCVCPHRLHAALSSA